MSGRIALRYGLSIVGGGCIGQACAHLHEPLLLIGLLALYARLFFSDWLEAKANA